MRHTPRIFTACSIFCLVLGLSSQALATSSIFYQIDVPGSTDTSANGINDSRQIVGSYEDTGGHGFLDTNGVFTTLDVPGAGVTVANGINNAGHIVGRYGSASGQHGFEYFIGGYRTIDPPGAFTTSANGINLSGQIVGNYCSTGVFCVAEPFQAPQHGFLLTGNTFTTIDVPGAFSTLAEGINASGDIVGFYRTSAIGTGHGFLETKQGKFTTIDVPGATSTAAFGTDKAGDIVGFFSDNTGTHGFLEDKHGHFATINYPGTTSGTEVFGINNSGDFVGLFRDSGGNIHGFLDPPADDAVATPEPSTWLLMGSGLIALLLWRRRKAQAA